MAVVEKIVAIFAVFLKFIDISTTYFVLSRTEVEVEGNPIMRYAINSIGLTPALSLSFVITSLLVWLAYKQKKYQALWIISVVLLITCINNILNVILFLNGA